MKILKQKIQVLENENKILKQRIEHLEKLFNVDFDSVLKEENITRAKPTKEAIIKERLNLYLSYFKGRKDVYALKSYRNGKKLYYPVIQREFKKWNEKTRRYDISRPQDVNIYEPLTQSIIQKHLNKFEPDFSIGIYPMLDGDQCYFVVIDFDGDSWKDDLTATIHAAKEYKLPYLIERSQSGNGAHLWFFFKTSVHAYKARRMATLLLSLAMEKSKTLNFDSYDRIFPSQDYLNQDGIGNLIALPLDGKSRTEHNSIFLNNDLDAVQDSLMWKHLQKTNKISFQELDTFNNKFDKNFEYINTNPQKSIHLTNEPQEKIFITLKDGILFDLNSLTPKTLKELRMIASFKNPEFFKKQRMRFSTWDTPRMIESAYKEDNILKLPRNSLKSVLSYLNNQQIDYEILNKRNQGRRIQVAFNGILKLEQTQAFESLSKHEMGVISAPTGFGKTVLGAKIIAHFKVNTLVIVPNKTLLYQWQKALQKFLNLDESMGLLGDGKNTITNTLDITIINSLEKHSHLAKNYGLVLVDECHHAAAIRYEAFLRQLNAKYTFGLSATPIRNDGLQKIIIMQLGDIIYELTHKESYESKSFVGRVHPVLTSFRSNKTKYDMHKIYDEIIVDESRNKLIADLTIKNMNEKRSVLILSNRTEHLDMIAKTLDENDVQYILITGSQTAKNKRLMFEKIENSKVSRENTLILSTGQFIGEGFDFPALDTLILATPIAWKGNIIQYVGRVNREHQDKNIVRIYDLVDFKVPVLSRMYDKRLSAYRKIGYGVIQNNSSFDDQLIYTTLDFESTLKKDILKAQDHIYLSIPNINLSLMEKSFEKLGLSQTKAKITAISNQLLDTEFISKYNISTIISEEEITNFILIDKDIIWYGSILIFGYNQIENTLMRLYNSKYFHEFKELID